MFDKIITFENYDDVPSPAPPIIIGGPSLLFLCEQDSVLLIERDWELAV